MLARKSRNFSIVTSSINLPKMFVGIKFSLFVIFPNQLTLYTAYRIIDFQPWALNLIQMIISIYERCEHSFFR